MTNGGISISVVIILLLHLSDIHVQAAPPLQFSFNDFVMNRDGYRFEFAGSGASIDLGALQITPDTSNSRYSFNNQYGRIMYKQPYTMWLSDDTQASFNSTFVINISTQQNWTAGEGLAFLIAPDLSIPQASDGKWLGLTNSTNDGNNTNQIVAIEFDTVKQDDIDPDGNHIGLNINSVISNKTVSLDDHNIKLSTINGTASYTVSVLYNGNSKLMEVYMVKEGQPMPEKPLLKETINLKQYVKQQSYFGFAASTGDPQIELNCVLKWSLEIDKLHKKSNLLWLKIGAGVGVPGVALLILCGVLYLNKRRRRRGDEESMELGTQLRWLPGMPREFKYKDLKKATNNFHENMKLGQGGFGVVYKGILQDKDHKSSTEIAVKKFSRDKIGRAHV